MPFAATVWCGETTLLHCCQKDPKASRISQPSPNHDTYLPTPPGLSKTKTSRMAMVCFHIAGGDTYCPTFSPTPSPPTPPPPACGGWAECSWKGLHTVKQVRSAKPTRLLRCLSIIGVCFFCPLPQFFLASHPFPRDNPKEATIPGLHVGPHTAGSSCPPSAFGQVKLRWLCYIATFSNK